MAVPEVWNQLEKTKEDRESVSFLVEWPDPAGVSTLEAVGTKRERLERLKERYGVVKTPLLGRLSALEGVQVKDLSATGQAIVTAPAYQWRKLIEKGGLLDEEVSGIRVLPNVTFHAL